MKFFISFQHVLDHTGVKAALIRVVIATLLSVKNETESVNVRLDGLHPTAQV